MHSTKMEKTNVLPVNLPALNVNSLLIIVFLVLLPTTPEKQLPITVDVYPENITSMIEWLKKSKMNALLAIPVDVLNASINIHALNVLTTELIPLIVLVTLLDITLILPETVKPKLLVNTISTEQMQKKPIDVYTTPTLAKIVKSVDPIKTFTEKWLLFLTKPLLELSP